MPTELEPRQYTVTGHALVPVEVSITVHATSEIRAVRKAEKLFKERHKDYVATGHRLDSEPEWRWVKLSPT